MGAHRASEAGGNARRYAPAVNRGKRGGRARNSPVRDAQTEKCIVAGFTGYGNALLPRRPIREDGMRLEAYKRLHPATRADSVSPG